MCKWLAALVVALLPALVVELVPALLVASVLALQTLLVALALQTLLVVISRQADAKSSRAEDERHRSWRRTSASRRAASCSLSLAAARRACRYIPLRTVA